MEKLAFANHVVALVFMACYAYQFVYLFAALAKKPPKLRLVRMHRYAVVISARNEEAVIGQLIASIRGQTYPRELIDIFVVADNCADQTADAAFRAGAIVWERFNRLEVGKGYALAFLFDKIRTYYAWRRYDGYFIFDADNLLDEAYIAEMNKTFTAGYRIVTSYRNSKNYASNWISAGYSLWFLRDSRYLNGARMLLGTSCAVSGTGFLVHRDIVERDGGWKHFLLTEDAEFTIDNVLRGERIAYCGEAVLYDEQPVTFGQSWRQRMRWARGFLQVFRKYGGRLFARTLTDGSFACFDMAMSVFPAIMLTIFGTLLNLVTAIISLMSGGWDIAVLLRPVWETLRGAYLLMLVIGLVTVVTEWRRIHCVWYKKIGYTFTFPLFMLTYIPISLAALFRKVAWTPIRHSVAKSLEEVRAAGGR